MSASSARPELVVFGEIASGGMGSVELARLSDENGHHTVAVKRMHPEYARDIEFVRMFRDEIWMMGALQHPNVVSLVGYGEDEAGPYLVMEWIDGVALQRIAAAGRRGGEPMSEELVAFVAARAAEGLHAAHSLHDAHGEPLEIVHRDVTPSNLLIGFDGSVRVTDFGIAKAAGKSSRTMTGVIKGKIAYMSPEYAARKAVDGRADLYSLGVVMFELLVGKTPFVAIADLELLKLVAYASAPPLRSVAPAVDATLAGIIDRLLEKVPTKRHTNGVVLARELDAWLEARGRTKADLATELASYADRHAGTRRQAFQKMLDDDVVTDPRADAETSPRHALETQTFTFFPRPVTETTKKTPEKPEEDRPRTRKDAVAAVAPVAIPVEPDDGPGDSTATAPTLPQRQAPTVARPPVPATTLAKPLQPRRRAPPALLGILVGAAGAVVLLLVFLLAGSRRAESNSPPSAEDPAAATSEAPSTDLVPRAPEPLAATTESPPPENTAPPGTAMPSARPPVVRTPAATRPPRQPTRTNVKSSKPCTPASFDYPECLKK